MNSTTTAPPVAVVAAGTDAAKRAGNQALMFIAVFKLLKALLFFAVAFGLLRMLHKDTAVELTKLVHVFRIDSDRAYIKTMLTNAADLQDKQKLVGSCLAAFSGLMFCIEGIGLLLRKKWAEYFTIILTSCGIPIELYEVFHRTTHVAHAVAVQVPEEQRAAFVFDKMMLLKIGALLLNSLIVWFLIAHLQRQRRNELALGPTKTAATPVIAENSGTSAGVAP